MGGSKHEKRWQDVEELLDAGISVMATLNIQHLESLHDIVLRETGVDVRERLPDRIVSSADEVVVIDLPPSELQERLREGKVYPPEKVEHALRRFFTSKNLAALRQLALREVANAVEQRGRREPGLQNDEQVGPRWHPVDAERVMVSMSSRPNATRHLLRHGARLAGGLNSRWFVVYVRNIERGRRTHRRDEPALAHREHSSRQGAGRRGRALGRHGRGRRADKLCAQQGHHPRRFRAHRAKPVAGTHPRLDLSRIHARHARGRRPSRRRAARRRTGDRGAMNRRVLVIEPDQAIRRMLELALSAAGICAHEHFDGGNVTRRARRHTDGRSRARAARH